MDVDVDGDLDVNATVDVEGITDGDLDAHADLDADAYVARYLPAAPLEPPRRARSRWIPTFDLVLRLRRHDDTADDHQILFLLRWS